MFNRFGKTCVVIAMCMGWSAHAEDESPREVIKIVGEVCVSCHGQDGNAMLMGAPKLGGQKADYLVKALMDYQSGARNNAIMSAFSGGLSTAEMKALGKYFEGQSSTLSVPR
ncbi:MAG: c-type cytochrome [Proteobacteria bacterium]|nr:c-type cytochrome [Pseudomonadota bacterium]MDA1331369.1 c-type cytochrome [Pseudomonadota bacterium]